MNDKTMLMKKIYNRKRYLRQLETKDSPEIKGTILNKYPWEKSYEAARRRKFSEDSTPVVGSRSSSRIKESKEKVDYSYFGKLYPVQPEEQGSLRIRVRFKPPRKKRKKTAKTSNGWGGARRKKRQRSDSHLSDADTSVVANLLNLASAGTPRSDDDDST